MEKLRREKISSSRDTFSRPKFQILYFSPTKFFQLFPTKLFLLLRTRLKRKYFNCFFRTSMKMFTMKNYDRNPSFCGNKKEIGGNKEIGVKVLVGDRKIGEKLCRVIFSTRKILSPSQKIHHFPLNFFPPIRYKLTYCELSTKPIPNINQFLFFNT